jgi:hypothetical protein
MEDLRLYTSGPKCSSDPKCSPWCEYSRRSLVTKMHDLKLYNRFGQRKLLISEVQFLTHFLVKFIIYAGSACGIHIKYLSALFPNVTFYLIDPSPFDRDLTELPNVILQATLFTNECIDVINKELLEWGINPSQEVGFISDIRSESAVPEKKNSQGQQNVEDGVLSDMNMQMEWIRRLRPKHAMLKFRLPYIVGMEEYVETQNHVRYLDGIILKQIYSPEQSSESRLIVTYNEILAKADPENPYPMVTYDCRLYENQMYFYNRFLRIRRAHIPDEIYDNIEKFKPNKVILRRGEIALECEVWKEYLVSRAINPSPENIVRLINDATKSIFESYLK